MKKIEKTELIIVGCISDGEMVSHMIFKYSDWAMALVQYMQSTKNCNPQPDTDLIQEKFSKKLPVNESISGPHFNMFIKTTEIF